MWYRVAGGWSDTNLPSLSVVCPRLKDVGHDLGNLHQALDGDGVMAAVAPHALGHGVAALVGQAQEEPALSVVGAQHPGVGATAPLTIGHDDDQVLGLLPAVLVVQVAESVAG